MSSNPPEDSGPKTSSTPNPTDTGSTPGPESKPKGPGLLKRAAKKLGSNIANQLTHNLDKPGEKKKDDKDKKPEDLMKLVDGLSEVVGNINKSINGFLGGAIQKGFDKIVAKVKGNKSDANPSEPSNTDPTQTTPSSTQAPSSSTQTTPSSTQDTQVPPSPTQDTQDTPSPTQDTQDTPSPTQDTQDTPSPTQDSQDMPSPTPPVSGPTTTMSALPNTPDPKKDLESTNIQSPESGQDKAQPPEPEPTESLGSGGPSGP